MTFWEKVQTVAQPMWHMQMGGLPQSEEIRPQYFPTYPIYFFTSFHRYLGWRYILTMFFAGLGMRISAANRHHALGRALGWHSLYVGSHADGFHLCRPIC